MESNPEEYVADCIDSQLPNQNEMIGKLPQDRKKSIAPRKDQEFVPFIKEKKERIKDAKYRKKFDKAVAESLARGESVLSDYNIVVTSSGSD